MSLARSAGDDKWVMLVEEACFGGFEGASLETACLCNAYSSNLSRFDGVFLGFQFFICTTFARNEEALTVLPPLSPPPPALFSVSIVMAMITRIV